jgi:cytochrome P450
MAPSSTLATLDGPAPMPILGWRGNLVRFFRDPIAYMAPLPRAHGAVVAFTRGGSGPVVIREATRGTVFAFSPSCAQAVWSQMSVFHSTRVPGPPESQSFRRLTSGLFSMNEDKHRQQRRLIQPAFHKARVDGYRDTMVELAERTVAGWRTGETHDLSREMTPLTLAVANKALFGLDPTPGELSIGERIQEVIALSLSPATLVPLNLPLTPRRRLIDTCDRVERDLRAVIARKRAAGTEGNDVLATLLATRDEDGSTLTDDELIGQLFILFFAGHDTTKNAIAWTMFLLAQHPRILADVRDELRGVLGGDAPTIEQLARLSLLDRVVKESLRVLPPVPFTGRITAQPTALEGVELPAGVEVILSPYCLHRDPDLYPEPQRFRPERWEKLAPSPFEYAPFGAGPRMCIGAGFAGMELKIVLSILLQRFDFELAPGARIDRHATIVMSPRHGMPMILRPPGTAAPPGRVRGDIREMVNLP